MKPVLITCWICKNKHSLFWIVTGPKKKQLSVLCNRYPKMELNNEGDSIQVSKSKVLTVDKEFYYLIDGNPVVDKLELPEEISRGYAKRLNNQKQFEMLPLLERKKP